MAPFTLPATLKGVHLKTLCIACGLPSSGTKRILSDRIIEAVNTSTRHNDANRATEAPRVLSIDMGIRNLAFCLLGPEQQQQQKKKLSRARITTRAQSADDDFRSFPSVKLHAWRRADLVPADGLVAMHNAADVWSPASMAKLTLDLVCNKLVPLKPTHILIERQRFRSGGAAAVQEWTLRVNTLEAMMHAVLRTLMHTRKVEPGLEIHSISPGSVGPFWLGSAEELDPPREVMPQRGTAKTRNKNAKIDVVGRWLEGRESVGSLENDEVKTTARMYDEKWTGRFRTGKAKEAGGATGKPEKTRKGKQAVVGPELKGGIEAAEEEVEGVKRFKKLDDLADCLLQGMAWVKWEENKRRLGRDGVDAILGDLPETKKSKS
jgi:cruciform cutting endonuclease 1